MIAMPPDNNIALTEDITKSVTGQTHETWFQRLWHTVKRYPLPFSALTLMLISLFFWIFKRPDLANWTLFTIVLLGGIPLLWETLRQFMRKEFSIDVIAIMAIIGSLLLGEYLAGAFVVLMLSGGEALEAFALRNARRSLSALAERTPRTAHIWQDNQLLDVPADRIEVGMTVVVKPGELVPVDGVVESGESSVSEADLTGEPVPVRKAAGTTILSGSVNLDGVIEVKASKRSAESQYAQIVKLVQEAQEQKAPIHRLADRYSVAFTAATVLLAALAWLISKDSVYALAVLVVATPCPLILATPIAIMSGIDVAARQGIIIKSGGAIEQLGEVDVAVFDKTGTLTLGVPELTTILHYEQGQLIEHTVDATNPLLYYAASVEQLSTHILARAIVQAAKEQHMLLNPADDFEEVFGKGIQGYVPAFIAQGRQTDGEQEQGKDTGVVVAVGNRTFMHHLEIALPVPLQEERERRTEQGQICSFIALDGQVMGLLVMEDVPRAELALLSPELKNEGIKQTVLLTGDSEVVAQQIGKVAQIDRIVAKCLPEEKVRVVRDLEQQKHRVLMVGDGVNDAPALAAATVGMALGSYGLTAAASAADTVLLSTDIMRVVRAVHLGRRVMRIAQQGIWIGMGLSGLAMLFAALGYIPPATGAILQEGIDVLVIMNALRVSAGNK